MDFPAGRGKILDMVIPNRIDERIQELEERIGQQKNLLDRLKARKAEADRKADTRRKILAGAVILKKAQKDPAFAAQLNAWLDAELTAQRDRNCSNYQHKLLTSLSRQTPE